MAWSCCIHSSHINVHSNELTIFETNISLELKWDEQLTLFLLDSNCLDLTLLNLAAISWKTQRVQRCSSLQHWMKSWLNHLSLAAGTIHGHCFLSWFGRGFSGDDGFFISPKSGFNSFLCSLSVLYELFLKHQNSREELGTLSKHELFIYTWIWSLQFFSWIIFIRQLHFGYGCYFPHFNYMNFCSFWIFGSYCRILCCPVACNDVRTDIRLCSISFHAYYFEMKDSSPWKISAPISRHWHETRHHRIRNPASLPSQCWLNYYCATYFLIWHSTVKLSFV